MSPSEFQLRAALHDGEGESPDPNSVIAHAAGVRRQRRHRINTVLAGAGAVVVVAGCAVAIALARGDGSGGGPASAGGGGAQVAGGAQPGRASAGSANSAAGAATNGGSRQAGGPAPRASSQALSQASSQPGTSSNTGAAAIGCPTTPDSFMLPGGGGLGKFGSTDPLLDPSVTSLRVCGYPERVSAERTTVVLDGASAREIVTQLNAAPAVAPRHGVCPANVDVASGTVELFGVTASGSRTDPVVITLSCPVSKATNGTAVRYVQSLPEQLVGLAAGRVPKSTAGTPTR